MIGKRGAERTRAWVEKFDSFKSDKPEQAGRAGDDAAARPARRLGRRPAELRGRRREGPRHPQGLEQGPERDRRAGAVADRRLLRPHRLDLGPAQRRRPVRAGQLRRPPGPLRDPRTRRRRGLQRDVDGEAAPALVDLPHLLRLRQGRDPPLGADGAAGRPPLHPRLDRPRRGRPDPPAGRAARRPAGDAAARRDPPRRRQRGDRGLEDRARPHPPPGRDGDDPAERAGLRPLQVRLGRGGPARRLRPRRPRGRRPGADPDRHRQRGPARPRRPRAAAGGRDPQPRRQPPLLGDLREAGPVLPRRGAAAGDHRPARDRGGLAARLGEMGRYARARSWV